MNNFFKITIGILVVVVILVCCTVSSLIGLYNDLNTSSHDVDNSWGQVQVVYQRRFDLIPNLVASIKGEMGNEQTIFKDIADARANYAGAKTPEDQAKTAGAFDSAISRLLVITENYPVLQSSELVKNLMVQVEGAENRIAVERSRYNQVVTTYNVKVTSFPTVFMANTFGFKSRYLFESTQGADKAPEVKF